MKVIEIEKLSKKYTLSHQGAWPNTTLVETMANTAKRWLNPFKKRPPQSSLEEFWALKDCSFSIDEGDRVGIVGRNGAGKSTLLKILSRITEPTSGRVKIRGRISSLLEVGTGFHPELTGRENIFLNGAIMGMRSDEIRKKFDEIVAFAEVEKFIDTPVKRYSSGMYTRLGFAVAAHMDPDILIIDEVLAVGDTSFQEKCLKRLKELGQVGRTVIFVSHDTMSILNLCNKGIYLSKGRVEAEGAIGGVVESYLQQTKSSRSVWEGDLGDEHIRFSYFGFTEDKEFYYHDEKPVLKISYEVLKPDPDLHFGFSVMNSRNHIVARGDIADDPDGMKMHLSQGKHTLYFPLSTDFYSKGEYTIRLECVIHNVKPIIIDNPVIKFPVYPKIHNPRFAHLADKGGVILGYQWRCDHG